MAGATLLHILLTPEDLPFNRDVWLELPCCWILTMNAMHMKPRPSSSYVLQQSDMYGSCACHGTFFPIILMRANVCWSYNLFFNLIRSEVELFANMSSANNLNPSPRWISLPCFVLDIVQVNFCLMSLILILNYGICMHSDSYSFKGA